MRIELALTWVLMLTVAPSAFAHRLNEYLQATTVGVARRGVTLNMRLTPGVDVAATIIAAIDTDRDGSLSSTEQQAYSDRVRRDLSLTVDGHASSLRVISSSFGPLSELLSGQGDPG